MCRSMEQYAHAEAIEGVLILRVCGPLCFANVEHVKEKMAKHEVRCCRCEDILRLSQAASGYRGSRHAA